jgi:hypothetical protein
MSRFKVGDRVAAYGPLRHPGVVKSTTSINGTSFQVFVRFDNVFNGITGKWFHAKECRKLVKKQKQPKMTKPFDPTKPVQTRDGRKARIICTDRKWNDKYPLVALVTSAAGEEYVVAYRTNGKYIFTDKDEDDLINIPEQAPIKLEVGGVYKSEGGDIVIVAGDPSDDGYYLATYMISHRSFYYKKSGIVEVVSREYNLIEHLGNIRDLHPEISKALSTGDK